MEIYIRNIIIFKNRCSQRYSFIHSIIAFQKQFSYVEFTLKQLAMTRTNKGVSMSIAA
jgi:hypothetical protein